MSIFLNIDCFCVFSLSLSLSLSLSRSPARIPCEPKLPIEPVFFPSTRCPYLLPHATFYKDLQEEVSDPTTIYYDNLSSIQLAKNPVFHARTKHI